jgi:hypothetical protein
MALETARGEVPRVKITGTLGFDGCDTPAVIAGVPLMVVARNLGHVDTKTVEKHRGLAPSIWPRRSERKRRGSASSPIRSWPHWEADGGDKRG